MSKYLIQEKIMELYSKYDPDLTLDIAPDEFGRILSIVEHFRLLGDINAIDTALLREWHKEGIGTRNFANRSLACLAKAIHERYGKDYVMIVPKASWPLNEPFLMCGDNNFEKKILERCKAGDKDAKVFFAIYKYFCSIQELSKGSSFSDSEILENLYEANNIFPSIEIENAIKGIKGLFNKPQKSGCFIATAAMGTPLAKEVIILSKFRDRRLSRITSGRKFISFYNNVSPSLARLITDRKLMCWLVQSIIQPMAKLIEITYGNEQDVREIKVPLINEKDALPKLKL
ncbi:MAG: hypothetical protein C4567_04515 [Deltaproteobacteria bacterium]|nr:MAG: hypothetical protein C4567_04515 [Deltaproteobacteria bacterium]